MDDLVRWLGEQLDEDEQIAQGAPLGPWSMDGAGSVVGADGSRVVPSVGGALNGRVTRWPEGPAAAHILGHDPVWALCEIEVKRRVLRDLEQAEVSLAAAEPNTPPHDLMTGAVNTLRRVVRLHASAYAARPGYLTKWAPVE